MTGTFQAPPITSPYNDDNSGIAIKGINGESTATMYQGQYVALASGANSTFVLATAATADKIVGVVFAGEKPSSTVTIKTDFCRLIKGKAVANTTAGALLTFGTFDSTTGIYPLQVATTGQFAKFVALHNASTNDVFSVGELKTAIKIA